MASNPQDAGERDHVDTLLKAREQLVAQRRDLAAFLADAYQRGHTDERREQFINIQRTLDAIDRAIDDERATQGVDKAAGQAVRA